jgi:hypothetical protein
MQLLELFPNQLFVQLDQLVPQLVAILKEDVSMMQLFVKVLLVLNTHAILNPTNVKS